VVHAVAPADRRQPAPIVAAVVDAHHLHLGADHPNREGERRLVLEALE